MKRKLYASHMPRHAIPEENSNIYLCHQFFPQFSILIANVFAVVAVAFCLLVSTYLFIAFSKLKHTEANIYTLHTFGVECAQILASKMGKSNSENGKVKFGDKCKMSSNLLNQSLKCLVKQFKKDCPNFRLVLVAVVV